MPQDPRTPTSTTLPTARFATWGIISSRLARHPVRFAKEARISTVVAVVAPLLPVRRVNPRGQQVLMPTIMTIPTTV
jgi:hypothetical protein